MISFYCFWQCCTSSPSTINIARRRHHYCNPYSMICFLHFHFKLERVSSDHLSFQPNQGYWTKEALSLFTNALHVSALVQSKVWKSRLWQPLTSQEVCDRGQRLEKTTDHLLVSSWSNLFLVNQSWPFNCNNFESSGSITIGRVVTSDTTRLGFKSSQQQS